MKRLSSMLKRGMICIRCLSFISEPADLLHVKVSLAAKCEPNPAAVVMYNEKQCHYWPFPCAKWGVWDPFQVKRTVLYMHILHQTGDMDISMAPWS